MSKPAEFPPPARPLSPNQAVRYALLLTLTFVAAHAIMFWLALGPFRPGSNDVDLYAYWMWQGSNQGAWPGLTESWVYPVGALIPMVIPQLLGAGAAYLPLWCTMIALLNALTCLVAVSFVGLKRACLPLVWWLIFLVLLGPVAITRLDAAAMPLVLMALLVAVSLPGVAAVLLTVGAWIKVSPGVVLLPLFGVIRRRWRAVVAPAALTCVAVAALQLLAGGKPNLLLSFVSAEADRGLQVESVLATPVVVLHAIKGEELWVYNEELFTVETWGGLADAMAAIGDVAMWLGLIVIGLLVLCARRRPVEALLTGAFAAMAAMIVLHKVGSPQFIAWLAPAVVVGLIALPASRLWASLAVNLLVVAGLTMVVYPWGYNALLLGDKSLLVVLVVRNLLLTLAFGLVLWKLVHLARPGLAEVWGRLRGKPLEGPDDGLEAEPGEASGGFFGAAFGEASDGGVDGVFGPQLGTGTGAVGAGGADRSGGEMAGESALEAWPPPLEGGIVAQKREAPTGDAY
ncbi:MAG: DUF2029 domain-containing protein [Bifidobacteriaceae bacterium]|jgi:hypothetical protein|nr:DUF2029 domain-containing protein [Bifidobacteriaceae bacterium]